jgi:tubulin-folding cofactor B
MQANYTDVSAVEKYEMPPAEYESLPNSVLAWKKNQKLGRFDPNAGTVEEQKIAAIAREVAERNIVIGARCKLGDDRRGEVKYVGEIKEIPGLGAWVGIALDEPTGKNDGSVKGAKYFECKAAHGVFVRPERVEVGDFPVLDDLGDEFEEL